MILSVNLYQAQKQAARSENILGNSVSSMSAHFNAEGNLSVFDTKKVVKKTIRNAGKYYFWKVNWSYLQGAGKLIFFFPVLHALETILLFDRACKWSRSWYYLLGTWNQ